MLVGLSTHHSELLLSNHVEKIDDHEEVHSGEHVLDRQLWEDSIANHGARNILA